MTMGGSGGITTGGTEIGGSDGTVIGGIVIGGTLIGGIVLGGCGPGGVPTVEHHLATIYRKIHARNRADATAYALRHALR
jgi:hypothetical protein